jgi:hypothetical protein
MQMAQESKASDLGALQDAQRKAEALARSASVSLTAAYTKLGRAEDAKNEAKKKFEDAAKALDTAKRAVLEGARAVANG